MSLAILQMWIPGKEKREEKKRKEKEEKEEKRERRKGEERRREKKERGRRERKYRERNKRAKRLKRNVASTFPASVFRTQPAERAPLFLTPRLPSARNPTQNQKKRKKTHAPRRTQTVGFSNSALKEEIES